MTGKIIICKNCGLEKIQKAKGLCESCYRKQNLKVCSSCGKLRLYATFGLCDTCYKHEKGKSQPMHLNKSCSSYLGVTIAEQVLSKVFSNVTQMPYGNKGYDFICSKGMKIDVKSSTFKFDKRYPNHKGSWFFNIKRNTIPDYFLCIAFDNRENLNPLHLWLIPSEKISHLTVLGIAKTTIHKYSEYEMDLDKTLECCNKLKQI